MEIVQVQHRGETRDAIRCYGPSQYRMSADGTTATMLTSDGPRMMVVIPKGVRARMMGRFLARVFSTASAIGIPRMLLVHPTTVFLRFLLLAHEFVHIVRQARTMGLFGFFATYVWHIPITALRLRFPALRALHDHLEQEREADRIADEIEASITPEMELVPFDIEAAILAKFPDQR